MDISKEIGTSISFHQSGAPIEVAEDETGMRYSRLQEFMEDSAAVGPAGYRDVYAMSEAADAPVTEAEIGGTMAGFGPGKVAGVVGAPGDIIALATGLYKAAFPDADQGRLDAFIQQVGEVSNKFGSGATLGFLDDMATKAGVPEDIKKGFMQGAEVGSFFGLGQGAVATGKGVAAGAKAVAEGAPARIAERGEGVTLGMGVDPMAPIDEAIVAGQKALQKPTKENPVTAVAPTETEPGIIAFHGSGADFDQFSLEKIGTGEGAQAYGYGLYFTDSEDIAKFYRDAISMGNEVSYKGKPIKDLDDDYAPIEDNIAHMVGQQSTKKDQIRVIDDEISRNMRNLAGIEQSIKDYKANPEVYKLKFQGMELDPDIADGIKDDFKDKLDASIRVKENIDLIEVKPAGKMYKVGLKPSPEDMLDYQTTFADQPKKVQDALKAVGYEVEKNRVGQTKPKSQIDLAMRRPMPMILESLKGKIIGDIEMGELEPGRADEILSKKLLEQGVPGIKYRAAGSRAGSIDAADAEMNYVIFDDKAIKILEKYGIVGPVAITALGAAKQEGDEDASST